MASFAVLALAATTLASARPFEGPALTLAQKRNNEHDGSDVAGAHDYYTTLYSSYGAKDVKETCVVAHTEGEDDTPNLLAAYDYCGHSDVEIVFAANTTYNIVRPRLSPPRLPHLAPKLTRGLPFLLQWSPFELANMSNVLVSIEGNLNFPENRTLIQEQVANITECVLSPSGSLLLDAR